MERIISRPLSPPLHNTAWRVTPCIRHALRQKWTDRITNDEVFQKVREDRLILKILKSRRHSWKGHTIRHNEFVVNILEGARRNS